MDQKQNSSGKHKSAPPKDPTNPASKPNATTQDQVANMESEGQAQQPGQEPPPDSREEKAEKDRQKR
jgi:hypothetical protein